MSVLNPPEELEYATCDLAEAAIQENAKQQGYAVARNKPYITTKKKRGRPKGSKNKQGKKQGNEQLHEEMGQQRQQKEVRQQQRKEVAEASGSSYNTRRARRSNYALLDDPYSSE